MTTMVAARIYLTELLRLYVATAGEYMLAVLPNKIIEQELFQLLTPCLGTGVLEVEAMMDSWMTLEAARGKTPSACTEWAISELLATTAMFHYALLIKHYSNRANMDLFGVNTVEQHCKGRRLLSKKELAGTSYIQFFPRKYWKPKFGTKQLSLLPNISEVPPKVAKGYLYTFNKQSSSYYCSSETDRQRLSVPLAINLTAVKSITSPMESMLYNLPLLLEQITRLDPWKPYNIDYPCCLAELLQVFMPDNALFVQTPYKDNILHTLKPYVNKLQGYSVLIQGLIRFFIKMFPCVTSWHSTSTPKEARCEDNTQCKAELEKRTKEWFSTIQYLYKEASWIDYAVRSDSEYQLQATSSFKLLGKLTNSLYSIDPSMGMLQEFKTAAYGNINPKLVNSLRSVVSCIGSYFQTDFLSKAKNQYFKNTPVILGILHFNSKLQDKLIKVILDKNPDVVLLLHPHATEVAKIEVNNFVENIIRYIFKGIELTYDLSLGYILHPYYNAGLKLELPKALFRETYPQKENILMDFYNHNYKGQVVKIYMLPESYFSILGDLIKPEYGSPDGEVYYKRLGNINSPIMQSFMNENIDKDNSFIVLLNPKDRTQWKMQISQKCHFYSIQALRQTTV